MRTRNIPVTAVTFALASVLPPAGVMAQDVIPRSLGATTQALVDTFDKPGDWGLPDGHGSTRDTGGAIQMDLDSEGWMWGSRDLSATHHPVVRIAGTVAVDGTGASGGWMCGTPGSAYGFGVVDGAGAWQIGHVIDGEVTVIADGLLPESARAGGSGETLVDVQCGQVNVDVTQVLLSIDGVPVGTANVPPIGPFGQVAFVGTSTTSEPATITFDDLAVWTGPRYASSDEPGPTVGPVATPRSVDTLLGADTVVFRDDFTTPDLWGVGAGKDAFVTYQDGQLAITVLTPDASRWSWRGVAGNHPVMRVEGPVTPGPAAGSAGWMCGNDGTTPDFLYGLVSTDGRWLAGDIIEGVVRIQEEGTLPGDDRAPGTRRDLVLECGEGDGASSRLALWVDGVAVADLTTPAAVGPFSKAGAFAGAREAPFTSRFDDAIVSTDPGTAPPGD